MVRLRFPVNLLQVHEFPNLGMRVDVMAPVLPREPEPGSGRGDAFHGTDVDALGQPRTAAMELLGTS